MPEEWARTAESWRKRSKAATFMDGVSEKGSRITMLLLATLRLKWEQINKDQLKVIKLADNVSFFLALKRKCEMEVWVEKSRTKMRREKRKKERKWKVSGFHWLYVWAATSGPNYGSHTAGADPHQPACFVIRTIILRYEFNQTHTERSPGCVTTSNMTVPPPIFKTKATC